MQLSQNGLDLIKRFEGCSLHSYQDVAGIWTIGYGHTERVTPHMVIDQQEADHLLMTDLQGFVNGVNAMVKSPINQNQFDALVSFSFNLGLSSLKTSNLLKYFNQRSYNLAAMEFLKWNHARIKGQLQVIQGLTNRREAEKALFLKPIPNQYQSYTIRSGESLSKIAARMGITLKQIILLNPQIKNPDLVYAGQKIKVPTK